MSNLYEKAGKRNSPLNTVKLADRAIPTSGQVTSYQPPVFATQNTAAGHGQFQTNAPGLASTTHDDILEFNTSALTNSNTATISTYSPTTLNNSPSPTISAYNRGTVLNRFNQGSTFALGPATSGPSMDVGLAATDYRARTAGNRETES
jgi:hypothetical protein